MGKEVLTILTTEPGKGGRPSDYSEELARVICERLSNGESLRRICSDEDMPNRNTVLDWAHDNPAFQARYVRARENQAEFGHDAMVEIEQRVLQRKIDPKAANVVLGNMRWRMEKLKPKVFGAKAELVHTGKVSIEQLVAGDDPADPSAE